MEPIFTLPYPEFCVAQQLARVLPASQGYSLSVPVSRQQPGVDLVLARRRRGQARVAYIQVKSSRTYSSRTAPVRTKRRLFRYDTRFKNFACPPQADFFCLITLYPAVDAAQKRELGTWWVPQILLFSQPEMKRFLRGIRTVAGKKESAFGFGFNAPGEAVETRGDSARRYRDFSHYLLPKRLGYLKTFLSA